MAIVLDASAVIALLLDERGASQVRDVLHGALISTVNLSEVVARLADDVPVESLRAAVDTLALIAIAPDEATAFDAGRLRPITAFAGLSLGDRFCLALARRTNLPVLTADRAWLKIASATEVEVRLIR